MSGSYVQRARNVADGVFAMWPRIEHHRAPCCQDLPEVLGRQLGGLLSGLMQGRLEYVGDCLVPHLPKRRRPNGGAGQQGGNAHEEAPLGRNALSWQRFLLPINVPGCICTLGHAFDASAPQMELLIFIDYSGHRAWIMAGELNFHQLRLFCAVAKLGSISQAAEELHISQPSVSAQVREFEQRCGIELLHRLPRGVALTDAGRVVLDRAERIFSQARELQSALQGLRGSHSGTLTIGGSLTAGEYFLPTVAQHFRIRHPDVELVLLLENSATILAQILRGELDFGFVGTDTVDPKLTAVPCWQDEVVIIASPASLSAVRVLPTVELLRSQHFVVREPGSATRQVVEQSLQRHGMTVRAAMVVGTPKR
jgi:LysR family transcriptional regulator, transcriptional activator of the cysJI operon